MMEMMVAVMIAVGGDDGVMVMEAVMWRLFVLVVVM